MPSKNETIFGYKLHLLITVGGLISDFELDPANATDLEVGFEILVEHTALLWRQNCLHLKTIPRRSQKKQMST